MKRVKILYLVTIFIYLIQVGEANNEDIIPEINEEKNTKIYEGTGGEMGWKQVENCKGGNCIYKCCPLGQCIQKRNCTPCDAVNDFSLLSVYDKYISDTGKTVNDKFKLLTGLFEYDIDFKQEAVNVYLLEFNAYIIENGMLQLEMPNTYNRWTSVENDNFCIDYFIKKDGKLSTTPMIWASIEGEEILDSDISLTAGILVSCVFLLLVLVVYALLPELQNLCGRILMAYVASLFMGFLLLAINQLGEYTENTCIGLTVGIYFFLLASFCWMSVMSCDIWWTFRGYAKARPIHRRGECFKFLTYCWCAWGVPFLMAIALFVLNTIDMRGMPWFITPNVPMMGCFLVGGHKLVYLYIPMLILILCNWMFYLMTAFNVWRLSRGTAVLDSAAAGTPAAHRSQRNRLMVYLKLSVVMGINWLFEIISFLCPGFKGWYLSDTYNVLIGFLIFLIFVCKQDIYRKVYKRSYALVNTRRLYPGSSKSYSSSSSDSGPETTTLQICANPKGSAGYMGSMRSM